MALSTLGVGIQQTYGLKPEELIVSQLAVADGFATNGDLKAALEICLEAASGAQKLGSKKLFIEAQNRLKRWQQNPKLPPSGPASVGPN